MRKHGLPPLAGQDAELLILGSLPGEKSLHMRQYYAHPQNQFWRVMAALLGEPLPDGYDARCAMLLAHRIALWDVVGSAEREGSLDSSIQRPAPNDIAGFLCEHPRVRRIALNGGKAAVLFGRYNQVDIPAIWLPSTSPAHARMRMEEKIGLWRRALQEE